MELFTMLVEDRLSSLTDEILIEILSYLPFQSAIITDTLSKRWRLLWTQITSVIFSYRNINLTCDFFTSVDRSFKKLTSPVIHTFIVDFKQTGIRSLSKTPINSWIHQICQRNVRHLSILLPKYTKIKQEELSYISRTRSLESIQLGWSVPYDNDDLIDLPNLKKFSVCITPSQCEWLNKFTESCPFLEDLSVEFQWLKLDRIESTDRDTMIDIKCSCPNLRRLSFDLDYFTRSKVVINVPKLEYMDARFREPSTIRIISDESIRLREAKLELLDNIPKRSIGTEVSDVATFYNVVRSVRVLTINIYGLLNIESTFPNLTHLTINMERIHYFETVLSFLQSCPLLDVLTLKFQSRPTFIKRERENITSVCALRRAKKLVIDICYDEVELKNYIIDMANYFTLRLSGLESFHFRVLGAEIVKEMVEIENKVQGV